MCQSRLHLMIEICVDVRLHVVNGKKHREESEAAKKVLEGKSDVRGSRDKRVGSRLVDRMARTLLLVAIYDSPVSLKL